MLTYGSSRGPSANDKKGYVDLDALGPVLRLAVLLAPLLMSGCLTAPGPSVSETEVPGPGASVPRVVIGVVDTGVNPYHEQFQDAGAVLPNDVLDTLTGLQPVPVELSKEGSYEERLQTDSALWGNLEPGRLYWFVGTRLLAISLEELSDSFLILDRDGHGTGVASTLRAVSRDAWVVMVQVPLDIPGAGRESALAAFEKSAEGIAWIAEQPWVDVVSLSIGVEGNPPLPFWEAYARATRRGTEAGKAVVAAAGNLPTPTVGSGTNGPPWVITVGGAEASGHGEQPRAAKMVDVVSDYTRRVADREPDAFRTAHGTSFGTPVVAGVLAQALLEMRSWASHVGGIADGILCHCIGRNLTLKNLRDALNASAVYWETTEWEPLNYSSDPVQVALFATVPVLPAPWVQMGWGYVGAESWRAVVSRVLDEPPLSKPPEAREYMAQQQALREGYWSRFSS